VLGYRLEAARPLFLPNQEIAKGEKAEHAPVSDEKIRGIVLVGENRWIERTGRSEPQGISVEHLDLPGKLYNLSHDLNPFLGRAVTQATLQEIRDVIVAYYRRANRPVIHVDIPEQRISSGIIQIVVYESKLGKVETSGNRYFSNKRLKEFIRLKKGDPIDADTLIQDLNWMNRNTFRQTDALFVPGQVAGTTDIHLLTKDRKTWRVYAGTDNTGLDATGKERWFSGINFGNFCNWDQLFTYQFTTGSNYRDFNASTFQWVIPLPWRNILSFFGGYSNVHARKIDGPFPGFGTHGQSMQASMRWDIPLFSLTDFLHEIIAGADWKRTNDDLTFEGDLFFGKSANLTQIVLGYNLGYEVPRWKVSFTWENFISPASWLPDQSRARYNDLRAFARPQYYYTRATFMPIYRHDWGWSAHLTMRGQGSTANLLSSEQYGIGGYNTVRGYEERLFNGDSALNINAEIRTPSWKLFWRKKQFDVLQLLAFYDYGRIWIHKQMIGEPASEGIDSVGGGVRYMIDQYLTARCDIGYALCKIEGQPRWRSHFSIVASY
jgi:hemolysin activation/secretion protein